MKDWNNHSILINGQEYCTEEALMIWEEEGNSVDTFSEEVAASIYLNPKYYVQH